MSETPESDERHKLPQKKAGKTVSRVVDPDAWMHADEDHPGTAGTTEDESLSDD